jgi:hypothetical protein
MSDSEQLARDLEELRYHWSSAYMISWAGGHFVAQRRDTYATVSADSAGQLFLRIREDYFAHPVPRRSATSRNLRNSCTNLGIS